MIGIEACHRRAVQSETIVSTAINSLAPTAIIWMLGAAPPRTLFGDQPMVLPMIGATGLATFLMTLILTMIIRARVRSGGLPRLDRAPDAWRLIPEFLPLRALALALLAVVLIVPAALAIVALAGILPLDPASHIAFNLAIGALVGIVMTRFVVIPALADPVRA